MLNQPNILLIEDQTILQRVHTALLHAMGCSVTVASTGEEAQAQLFPRLPPIKLFDAVILDLGLPDIHGIELCEWIRHFYNADALPIFAVTALGPENKSACLAAGMQGYFVKPLSRENWLEIINFTSQKDTACISK